MLARLWAALVAVTLLVVLVAALVWSQARIPCELYAGVSIQDVPARCIPHFLGPRP